MIDLEKHTLIELQKIGNDIKDQHTKLKQTIIDDTYELDKIEKRINVNIKELTKLEKNYVAIVEKLTE